MAAPPSTWQYEVAGGLGGRPAMQRQNAAAADVPDVQLSETWRHVKGVAREESKNYDLIDLMKPRQDMYQFPVPGWPSLLRPVSADMPELPAMVQDKYRSCQTMCFCGVFPEIRRAWASVDNSLFLWRYDRRGDVPVEYCGEEQAICCVGLAKPRPGVFLSAIQHVLLLATPVEIVLLGVCTSPAKGGGSDPYEELSLQPMPLYSLPSDTVMMTSFAASSSGRIFLGGSDGHVYEILYAATETWRQRRCSKVCVTGSLASGLLPAFLPSFLFGSPVPIDRLVLDDERHILYSLAANSAIQVFDLGPSGQEPAKKVAGLEDFPSVVSRLPSASNPKIFTLGEDKRATAIKYLAVIPMAESWKLHLMAVTSNGRRAYFTTNPGVRPTSGGSLIRSGPVPSHLDPAKIRPSVLVAVDARASLPQAPLAGVRVPTEPGSSRVMDVTAVLYAQGTLVLAESAGVDGKSTKLLLAARNHMLPPPSANITVGPGMGLRELVSELDQQIAGETTAIGCLQQPCVLGPEVSTAGSIGAMQDELVAQMFSGPPQLVVVSTAGVLQLERRRPVEVLQALLLERAPEKLQQFFKAYGAPEAAAMCYLLAASDNQSMRLIEEAASALENPLLVGQPLMPEEGLGGGEAAQNPGNTAGDIYMGMAVNPNPEPEWSGAHKGLALYVSRLLAPVWEAKLITPSSKNPSVWKARLSDATMTVLESKLRPLERFLTQAAARRKSRGFKDAPTAGGGGGGLLFGHLEDGTSRTLNAGGLVAAEPLLKRQRMWNADVMEAQRNDAIRQLASKAAQALLLLRTIAAANVNRLVNRLGDANQRALRELNFRDLVLEAGGPSLAGQLVAALIADQLDAAGGGGAAGSVGELSAALQAGAPAYFRDHDRTFFQATAKLRAAEEAGSAAEREAAAKEALAGLLRVPQCVDLAQLVPKLAFMRQYEGVVELVLRCAALADPHNLAWRTVSNAETAAARAARERSYAPLLVVLRSMISGNPPPRAAPLGAAAAAAGTEGAGAGAREEGALLTPAERAAAKQMIMQAILRSGDQYLVTVLYSTLVAEGADEDLLANPSPGLELYLRQEGGLGGQAGGVGGSGLAGQVGPLSAKQVRHLELLARLHIKKAKYAAAAGVYRALAERRSGAGDEAVTLEQRLDALHNALLQARSVGDEQLTDGLRGSVKVMSLQLAITKTLQGRLAELRQDPQAAAAGGVSREQLEQQLRELQAASLDISDLYNAYAQPHELWDICLEICDFAGSVPEEYVRQLWDLLLKQAWEDAGSSGSGAKAAEGDARLIACCQKVVALGVKFYPNEDSLPLSHITLRLEGIAAGLWPQPAEPATDTSRVVVCLRAVLGPAAGDNASGLIGAVYEQLLARRGALLAGGVAGAGLVLGGSGDGAARNALRLGLLRSLVAHCRIVVEEELSSALTSQPDHGFPSRFLGRAQQASALADLAQRCAAEARGLVGGDAAQQGQQLAAEFEGVANSLQAAVS